MFSLVSAAGEGAGPQSLGQTDVSGSAARKQLVESVAAVVETNYVFPDVAAKVAAGHARKFARTTILTNCQLRSQEI